MTYFGLLLIKNGQSEPILADIDSSSLIFNPSLKRLFIALIVNAASEEPPPRPDPMGIFLCKCTFIF